MRNFVPQARAFSLGNISGLKNESPLIWTKVSNSVYVAKIFKTNRANDCQSICLADNDCKAMIYNKLLGQCSLNIGEGPYREIPLGNQSQFGISSCIKLGGGGTGITVDSIIFQSLCLHSTRHWCQTTIEISLYNFCKSKILKYSSSNLPYNFFRPPSSKMVNYIVKNRQIKKILQRR